MFLKFLLLIILFFFHKSYLFSEENLILPPIEKEYTNIITNEVSSRKYSGKVITGWQSFNFKMSYKEVVEEFKKNYKWLTLKQEGIEGISESENEFFLETYNNYYLPTLQFQFNKNKELYLIRIILSEKYFSYLELLSAFKANYGEAFNNSFKKITWRNKDQIIELYRDRTIKYIDLSTFKKSSDDIQEKISTEEISPSLPYANELSKEKDEFKKAILNTF